MWIIYFIGIVLLMMFIKSMILNPILFKKRWQAGIGYGIPAAICLLIFFMSMYFDYSSEQAYFDDQRNRVTASNWQPPQVSGNVTPVNPGSSNYISIPVLQNKNLQNGLITLQKNLDSLQNTINSKNLTLASTVNAKNTTTANNAINARVDNPTPTRNSRINLIVTGPSGSKVTAVCHYKTKDTTYTGTIGNNGESVIKFGIGTSTPGYKVNIDVTVGNAKTQTFFTAQR